MNKRIIPILLLVTVLAVSGCGKEEISTVSTEIETEMSVTTSVNDTKSPSVTEISAVEELEEPVVEAEPEVDYSEAWAELPWPIEQIQKILKLFL